jgi:transposase InsO family protein
MVFLNLAYARAVIEAWRREYNEERVKKALGGGRTATVRCMSAYSTFRTSRLKFVTSA